MPCPQHTGCDEGDEGDAAFNAASLDQQEH